MKNIAKKNICHMIVLLLLTIIGNVQAASPIKKGYKLLFEETFRGDTLNTNDWYYREGRREGLGWVDGLNRKENVYVKDGLLHIILKRESINGRMENTGGGIITKHDFGYGYYECLSKPFMAGHGVHSSFWQRGSLTPNNDIFEIDSYEIDSKTFVATNNLYVSLAPKGMKYSPWPHRAQVPFTLDKDGWFLDAYEYTPDGVIFYDNNKVVAKADWHELNAAQMVWLTALNGVGKLDTTKLPGESIFKYFRYYAKDYPGVNILPNGNFEFNQDRIPLNKPVSWIVEGTEGAVNVVEGSAFRDNYKLRIGKDHPFFASVQQSLNYIMNGNYQLKAMVRTSNKLKDATIKAFGFGGKEVSVNIKNVNKWTKIVIPIIAVTNNHVSIAVSAAGNAKERFEIDDIQFLKPALKVKKNSKYRSFWDKDAPIWKLATKEPINFKGDQKFYFFDRNVGYGDSITVSFTVNAAVQANMTPIARIPQKGDSGWAIQLTKNGGVIFRIGSVANHIDIIASKVYTVGKPVKISCAFVNGTAYIYVNGKLLKKKTGIVQKTKDATAAGRLGTVGEDFEAVGAVVMEVAKKDIDTNTMKKFNGTLQNIRIYNRLAVR